MLLAISHANLRAPDSLRSSWFREFSFRSWNL